jgi:4-hydroxythreonine-4-phosphate dehydrogenase
VLKRIAITPGEPAGIGPDLMIKVAQQDWPMQMVAVVSPELLMARAKLLNLPLSIKLYNADEEITAHKAGTLIVLPVALDDICEPGVLNANNGRYVVANLTR